MLLRGNGKIVSVHPRMISMIYRATDWLRYKKTMADGVEDEFEALWRHRAAETEDEVMLRLQEIAGLLLESCRLIVEQPVRFQVSIFCLKEFHPRLGKISFGNQLV